MSSTGRKFRQCTALALALEDAALGASALTRREYHKRSRSALGVKVPDSGARGGGDRAAAVATARTTPSHFLRLACATTKAIKGKRRRLAHLQRVGLRGGHDGAAAGHDRLVQAAHLRVGQLALPGHGTLGVPAVSAVLVDRGRLRRQRAAARHALLLFQTHVHAR